MTADAYQQAKQIMDDFASISKFLWIGSAAAKSEQIAKRDRLVAALAAAIEETQAEDDLRGHALRDEAAIEKNRRLARAREARREALSALGVEVDGAQPHSGDSANEDSDE